MDKENLEDHLAYGREILERGDGYAAVRAYLKQQVNDVELRSSIIATLQMADEKGLIKTPEGVPGKATETDNVSIWMAYTMVALGTAMIPFLWRMGFVGFPILIIGLGVWYLHRGNWGRLR